MWAFSNAVLQMQAFNAWQSPNILAHKWGGGGGPPWGEFNGIETARCLDPPMAMARIVAFMMNAPITPNTY